MQTLYWSSRKKTTKIFNKRECTRLKMKITMSYTGDFVVCSSYDILDIPNGTAAEIILHYLQLRNPNGVAIVDQDTGRCVTYDEVLQNSIALFSAIKAYGIKKGDIIAIVSENKYDYYMPMIACVLAGAIVSFTNPAYTKGELQHAFEISDPKIAFVSEDALKNVLAAKEEMNLPLKVVTYNEIHGDTESIDQFKRKHLESNACLSIESVDLDDPVFMFSSSGTTGLPKGVIITNRNFRWLLNSYMHPHFGAMSDDAITVAYLPYFHILGMSVYLVGILSGMKVVAMSKFEPKKFLEAIEINRVTNLYLVPPTVSFLAKHSTIDQYNLSSLRHIFCGAAPLRKHVAKLAEIRINRPIRQFYGLTELSGVVLGIPSDCETSETESIGVATPGVLAGVWDIEKRVFLGPNETGELCFKSQGVMKGYMRNEKATREIIDGGGFLHTGDIGYYDENGFFYVVDRIKEIIKYKGFQVAPAELESILESHVKVREAGVVGIPDEKAGEVPLAFVVKQPNVKITERELIDFVADRVCLQKRLYGGVRFVNEIPRNSTGKILRRRLRDLLLDSVKSDVSL